VTAKVYKQGEVKLEIDGVEVEVDAVTLEIVIDEPAKVSIAGRAIKGARVDMIFIDDPLEPGPVLDSAQAAKLAAWYEADPAAGHVWAECLCDDIDPTDRPCMTCVARWPEGVPLFAIDLITGDVTTHDREPEQAEPFGRVPTKVLALCGHGITWGQRCVDALENQPCVLIAWVEHADEIGLKTTLEPGGASDWFSARHPNGGCSRFRLVNERPGILAVVSDNGTRWAAEGPNT